MLRTIPILLMALPAVAQEPVGSLTATIEAEEQTFVVVPPGEAPASGFERADGVVDVRLVAIADRTLSPETPVLELRFEVTGMGPTAEVQAASVRYEMPDGTTMTTGDGTAEVSLTAFGLEGDDLTAAGSFASQLQDDAGGMAELAVEGDFQASIRQGGAIDQD